MVSSAGVRSVRIDKDERTGWAAGRPRREGAAPPRPPQVAVRCRVLAPTDRQRYTPGSVVVVVGGTPEVRERFAQRFEERGAILSAERVRRLLAGRVSAEEEQAAVDKILDAAFAKRLAAENSVAILVDGLSPEARARFVVPAAKVRRPRHLIFLDVPKDQVDEADRDAVNELRRALEAGALGEEGFMTALRLSGRATEELQRIVFRPPPSDD